MNEGKPIDKIKCPICGCWFHKDDYHNHVMESKEL